MTTETAQIIQFAAVRPKLAKGERPKISGLHSPIVRVSVLGTVNRS